MPAVRVAGERRVMTGYDLHIGTLPAGGGSRLASRIVKAVLRWAEVDMFHVKRLLAVGVTRCGGGSFSGSRELCPPPSAGHCARCSARRRHADRVDKGLEARRTA